MEDRCANCRFWEQVTPDKKALVFGECHRYPPARAKRYAAPVQDIADIWAFPLAEEEDWCGEFSRRTNDAPRSTR